MLSDHAAQTRGSSRSGFPSGSSCGQAGLGPEDDLAAGVAAFELGVGLADLRQRVDVRDRHLEVSTAIRPASSASTLAPGPAAVPPSVFTPCFAAAPKSTMVALRSAAPPRARASSTYPSP